MSLHRRTYSPLSNTYSYSTMSSSTNSPTYSYSRVSTYLDALERDEAISKLKRQLTHVKSIEMKYHSLMQEIAIAEKENKLLENKNNDIENDYMQKIKQTKTQTHEIQNQLERLTQRMNIQEKNVEQVEGQVKQLLEELKKLKLEEQALNTDCETLQQDVSKTSEHMKCLNVENKKLIEQRQMLQQSSKASAQQMQIQMQKLTQLNEMISKFEDEIAFLQKQSQNFGLQEQNIKTIKTKNLNLTENLERKLSIQQRQTQQMKSELANANQQHQKSNPKYQTQKHSFYQNVISVSQQSLLLKQTLKQLDHLLETDSTQKKYLKDISIKQAQLSSENMKMRDLLGHLHELYQAKRMQETKIISDLKGKIENNKKIKQTIKDRDEKYTSLIKELAKTQ